MTSAQHAEGRQFDPGQVYDREEAALQGLAPRDPAVWAPQVLGDASSRAGFAAQGHEGKRRSGESGADKL